MRRVDLFPRDRISGLVNAVGLAVEANRLHERIGVGPSQFFEASTRGLSERAAPHGTDSTLGLILDPIADKSFRCLGQRHAWQDTHNTQGYRTQSTPPPKTRHFETKSSTFSLGVLLGKDGSYRVRLGETAQIPLA
jgi:hypothetical protein